MSYEFIAVDVVEEIATLTFNRPRVLNAFNNELMQESLDAIRMLGARDDVAAIIVTGEGRAFSAGFDLKASGERALDSVDKVRDQMSLQFDFIMQFWDCPKTTIAAVHGYCLAGAFEVSLACDLTIAAQGTFFGEPEVRFGTGVVAMLLPWITGPKQAKELLLMGDDRVTADEALRMGFINKIVSPDALMDEATTWAGKIARASSVSVSYTKAGINRSYEAMGMRNALNTGLDLDVMLNSTRSPEKDMFAKIRREQGVKAAIAWRDARFRDPDA
ncbi:MAG: enoyl-CoA hydratase/isomerase family protein [Pseudomonadota bacterium]